MVRQAIARWGDRAWYASADEPTLRDRAWIAAQWEAARERAADHPEGAVLALDEIHKTPQWSETVKRLWDEDTAAGIQLRVVLSGSARLPLQRGLTETLAGRFEVIQLNHWSLEEMTSCFGVSLEDFVYYGGFPGAQPLTDEPGRWMKYVADALIETTVSRDVLLLTRVDKPALLRQLFHLGSIYSGQILSYNKMLGQLQDAGNTTTLAHYLSLLEAAGMLRGIPKYSGSEVRRRASSPKLQVLNNAYLTVAHGQSKESVRADSTQWGRWIESAVGAHLANAAAVGTCDLWYWRHRNDEIDFVISRQDRLLAVEVKSGTRSGRRAGLSAFQAAYPEARPMIVGADGVGVEEFLGSEVARWLE